VVDAQVGLEPAITVANTSPTNKERPQNFNLIQPFETTVFRRL
jgi:hypothetical protein